MDNVVLVINAGSSSIKFSLFTATSNLTLVYHGEIDSIFEMPYFTVLNAAHEQILRKKMTTIGYDAALRTLFDWLQQLENQFNLTAVGHRVVHGGQYFLQPTLVTTEVMAKIASLNPLAPLHQPHNLEAINVIHHLYPELPQVACFDTTFHQTQHTLAKHFAIPRSLTDEGIIRYGFHGISYEYIASVMSNALGEIANKRVIAAHLGNGASMCAMYQRKSVATSMGLTPLDGLMMGTRCGNIDPGVLLYLLQQKQYSAKQLEELLYLKSGLLGVSGIDSDVRTLLSSKDKNAQEAIDLFCYRAALEVGSFSAALNGCDALIFTAGIGEHAALVRKKICDRLQWLGIEVDDKANQNNATIISTENSAIVVSVIATNEEYVIAKHTEDLCCHS